MAYKAKLQKKSFATIDLCEHPKCTKKATQEAVYGNISVRCCDQNQCKMYALKEAVDQANVMSDFNPWQHINVFYSMKN